MACHMSTSSLHYFFYYAGGHFYCQPFHNILFPVYDVIFTIVFLESVISSVYRHVKQ